MEKKTYQLTAIQQAILELLKHGATTRKIMSFLLNKSASTINDNLNKLLRYGLVTYNKIVKDRKGHPERIWSLTPIKKEVKKCHQL